MLRSFRFAVQTRQTKAATASGTAYITDRLRDAKMLLVTLTVFSAERDTGNETYDVYVTTGNEDGKSWDVVHFPQIATTGAKTFQARILCEPAGPLQNVTTATPGVAANDPAIFQTDTAGSAQGAKTLAAGVLRHGPIGNQLSHELVVAGTVATGIDYQITVEAFR